MTTRSRFLKISAVLTAAFFISSTAIPVSLAQGLPAVQAGSSGLSGLPAPGQMVLPAENFVPVMLRGLQLDPDKPLEFGFLIDSGNTGLAGDALKEQTEQLVKYFLTSLTVPDEHLWVNLSPGEDQRIIPEDFGITSMGQDLLAQDYILKQFTASLVHPEQELGKEFWRRAAEQVREKFGEVDIPTDMFTRVWVVPDKALVLENNGTALIAESRLRVLTEADYFASQSAHGSWLMAHGKNKARSWPMAHGSLQNPVTDDGLAMNNEQSAKSKIGNEQSAMSNEPIFDAVLHQILIPELEREVNEGAHFAPLRRIYHAMILAVWFKRHFQKTMLGAAYVGQGRIAGVETDDWSIKEKIYGRYMEALKTGVFDMIREEADPLTGEVIPRRYFSGGMPLGKTVRDAVEERSVSDTAMLAAARKVFSGRISRARVNLNPEMADTRFHGTLPNNGGIIGNLRVTKPVVVDEDASRIQIQGIDMETGKDVDAVLTIRDIIEKDDVLQQLSFAYDHPVTTRMLIWFEKHFEYFYVFDSQDAVVRGLGTPQAVAISDGLRDSPLAVLYMIGQAMANSNMIAAEEILRYVNDRTWYEERIKRPGYETMAVHYALRALFRELHAPMDRELGIRMKGLMTDQEAVREARRALGSEADLSVVLQEFHRKRGSVRGRQGEQRLLARLIEQHRRVTHEEPEPVNEQFAAVRTELKEIADLFRRIPMDQMSVVTMRGIQMLEQIQERHGRQQVLIAGIDFIFGNREMYVFNQFLISELLGEGDLLVPGVNWMLSHLWMAENPYDFEYLIEPMMVQTVRYLQAARNDWNRVEPLAAMIFRHMFAQFEEKAYIDLSTAEELAPQGSREFKVLFEFDPARRQSVVYLKDDFMEKGINLFRSQDKLSRMRDIFNRAHFSRFALHRLRQALAGNFQDSHGRIFHAARIIMEEQKRLMNSAQLGDVMDEIAPYFIAGASPEDVQAVSDVMIAFYRKYVSAGIVSDSFVDTLAYFAPHLKNKPQVIELSSHLAAQIVLLGEQITTGQKNLHDTEIEISGLLAYGTKDDPQTKEDLGKLQIRRLILTAGIDERMVSFEKMMRVLIRAIDPLAGSEPEMLDRIYEFWDKGVLNSDSYDQSVKDQLIAEMVRSAAQTGNPRAMRLVMNSLSLDPEERGHLQDVLDGVREGDMHYHEVRRILGRSGWHEDAHLLIILWGSRNRRFLQRVIADRFLEPELRVYAMAWYVHYFIDPQSPHDRQVLDHLRMELKNKAQTILGKAGSGGARRVLDHNPVISNEMLRTFAMSELLAAADDLIDIPEVQFKKYVGLVANAKMYRYRRNADSFFRIGGEIVAQSSSPDHFLLMLLAHEWWHNFSEQVYGLRQQSLRHFIVSEFVSDVGAAAMAQNLRFPPESFDVWQEDLDYDARLAVVMTDDHYAVEPHEGARAQQRLIIDRLGKNGMPVDWNRLLKVTLQVLPMMTDEKTPALEEFFNAVFDGYMAGVAPAQEAATIAAKRGDHLGLFETDTAAYFTGPMRERILSKTGIDAIIQRWKESQEQRQGDGAMLSAAGARDVGGVDLSERWLDLETVVRGGDGFSMQEAMSALGLEYLIGITPVIVEIVPVAGGNFLTP